MPKVGATAGSGDSGVPLLCVNSSGNYATADTYLSTMATALKANQTFGDIRTIERTQIIELKSVYGISALRDVTSSSVSGSVASTVGTDSEYILSTGASSSGFAHLRSAERGRYVSGYNGQMGIGVRIPTDATGNIVFMWGLFDTDASSPPVPQNGYVWYQDSVGAGVRIYRAGSKVADVVQGDWNVDKLDGTGASGLTLNLARGNIFNVEFAWYGYGTVNFVVNIPDSNGANQHLIVHRYRPDEETSVLNPDLPVSAQVENGATASNATMYVAGRQYSVVGKYTPNRRITSERRGHASTFSADVKTAFYPLISARRKDDYVSVSVKIDSVEIISDNDLLVEIRTGMTGLDGSYIKPTNTTVTETALETNITCTSVDSATGQLLWTGIIPGGSNKQTTVAERSIGFDLIETEAVTIVAQNPDYVGAGNTQILVVVRFLEEW